MRSAKIILCLLCILSVCALAQRTSAQTPAQSKRIVIAASVILDGKGHALRDTRIVIEGSKIVTIDPKAGPVDYDLRGLTVLPGWIDAHVRITSSFGKDGKNGGAATPQEEAYRTASNAWVTLMAGFTTVWRPVERHNGCPAGGICDEGRRCLQERLAPHDTLMPCDRCLVIWGLNSQCGTTPDRA
jgi:hypothetical protein